MEAESALVEVVAERVVELLTANGRLYPALCRRIDACGASRVELDWAQAIELGAITAADFAMPSVGTEERWAAGIGFPPPFHAKPGTRLELVTPSLPWKCSTN